MDHHADSTEHLTHIQCWHCGEWWFIGDAPDRDGWFCPWCAAFGILADSK